MKLNSMKSVTLLERHIPILTDADLKDEFIAGIKSYCSHYGMNYFLCDTHIPFEKLLTDYLVEGALFR